MNGCTKIGFAYGHVKGYCKRCKKLFDIGFNEINPLSRRDICPFCNQSDEVETDDWIDEKISIRKMFAENDIENYAQMTRIKKSLDELYVIKKIFEIEEKRRK